MPVTSIDPAQAKRNRLPFKPPSRHSAGSSSTGANKTAANKTTAASKPTSRKRASSTTASSSKTKQARKPSSSKAPATTANSRKRKAPSLSSDAESASEDNSENESNSREDNHGDDDDTPASSRSNSPFKEPDYILAEIVTNDRPRDIESGEPGIPPKLLTRLLHHHFQNSKTKITKDANEVVAKYMDIFVREILARAAYERAEGNAAANGGRSMADGFLEVEDLEKLAPQMLLDF